MHARRYVVCQSALTVELTSSDALEKSLFPCFPSNIIPAITVLETCKIVTTEEVRDSDSGKIILPPWILMEKSLVLLLPKSPVNKVISNGRLAPKVVVKVKKISKDNQTKILQQARRAAVLEERKELLLRKSLSVYSATCTPSIEGGVVERSLKCCPPEYNGATNRDHNSCCNPSYITGSESEHSELLMEETTLPPPSTPSGHHFLNNKQYYNHPVSSSSSYFSLPTPSESMEFVQRKIESIKMKEGLAIIRPGDPLLLEPIISLLQGDPYGETIVNSSGDCDWMKNLLNGERLWL